jgi:membrane peptidoglycan carboxypeptidase
MEVNLPELDRRMRAPRIRLQSGRTPRARVHGPGAPSRRYRGRSRLLRFAVVCAVGFVTVGVGGTAYAESLMATLPPINGNNAALFTGDTLVYDRNGKLLADLGTGSDGSNHRQYVSLDQVSPMVVKATVDVEDRTFWSNNGYDPESIVRAALGDVTHSGVQSGASTITQQLAKQLYLSSEQTLTRKVKELLLAAKLNSTYTKRQILELYLNVNNYGERQYGVQAAAKTYFQKDARDLDLAQASLLAGLPQAPYDYDPVLHMDAAKFRQKQVLDAMVRQRDITPLQNQQAYAEPLTVSPPNDSTLAPQFVNYVVQELDKSLGLKIGVQQMRVTTTLDWGKQQLGQQIVTDNLNKNKYRDPKGGLNSSMVAMDPKTGQILAYVGSAGRGSPAYTYDYAGRIEISPGSSVKPYTYAAAISGHLATMNTQIFDGPVPYPAPSAGCDQGYKVRNFVQNRGYGEQPLKVSFANSLNISAVKTEMAIGVPQLVDFYRNMGLKPAQPQQDGSYLTNNPSSTYCPSLTLGGYPITLLQHASGLSVFADLGTYHQPEAVLSVTDAKGRSLYQANPNRGARPNALDPGVAFIISSILGDDNNRSLVFGRGTPLHLFDHLAAAKTGTSEDYHDGLTVGWTPDLVSAFWIGDVLGSAANGYHMNTQSDGVFVAAPAWHQFMEQALRGVPGNHWYAPPSDVVQQGGNTWYLVDPTTGRPINDITHLPNDQAPPNQGDSGAPADPGTGPVPIGGGQGGRGGGGGIGVGGGGGGIIPPIGG